MYVDEVVIAGVLVVLMTIGFFGGVVWMIHKDKQKHPQN